MKIRNFWRELMVEEEEQNSLLCLFIFQSSLTILFFPQITSHALSQNRGVCSTQRARITLEHFYFYVCLFMKAKLVSRMN